MGPVTCSVPISIQLFRANSNSLGSVKRSKKTYKIAYKIHRTQYFFENSCECLQKYN